MDKDNIATEERFIVVNKIKCNHCNQVIQSYHVHDYVSCKCKKVACDGGNQYLKRTATDLYKDYTDLSLYSDSPIEEVRKSFRWGTTLDKQGNPRKNIKWEALYLMSKTHINAILAGDFAGKYKILFEKELKFRKKENEANK